MASRENLLSRHSTSRFTAELDTLFIVWQNLTPRCVFARLGNLKEFKSDSIGLKLHTNLYILFQFLFYFIYESSITSEIGKDNLINRHPINIKKLNMFLYETSSQQI